VFEGSNKIHKMIFENDIFSFKLDSSFSLGVNFADDVIKIQKKYILRNQTIQLKIDPKLDDEKGKTDRQP